MCVANSARSQLAEGLAKSILGPDFKIESAGSKPSKVNSYAIQVLSEVGIDISHNRSKSVFDLDSEFVERLDLVIALCEEEVCPAMVTKAKKLHWPLPDPAGSGNSDEQLTKFRNTRDEIKKKLLQFFEARN